MARAPRNRVVAGGSFCLIPRSTRRPRGNRTGSALTRYPAGKPLVEVFAAVGANVLATQAEDVVFFATAK